MKTIHSILTTGAAFLALAQFVPSTAPLAPRSAEATVTANIGGEQGGDLPYVWSISYDDVTRRVTAEATAVSVVRSIRVEVQITTGGATRVVDFVQPGRTPDADTDFPVTIGAGPTLIGPSINPNQVARMVGKIGSVLGGLPFNESWSRF